MRARKPSPNIQGLGITLRIAEKEGISVIRFNARRTL
jgi:hypothetical protein